MLALILTLAILTGQLIKIPLFGSSGLTTLDLALIFTDLYLLFQIKFKLKSPPLIFKLFSLFIFIAIFSLILNPLSLEINNLLISLSYSLRLILFLVTSYLIYLYPTLHKQIPIILIISGVGLAFFGLLQLIFFPNLISLSTQGWDPHFNRAVSTLLDPNFLGAFLVLTLLLLTTYKFSFKLKVILFILTFGVLLTTYSRSASLMFGASFLSLSFLQKSSKLFLLTLILSIVIVLNFSIYQKTTAEPRNIDRTKSAQARLGTWEQGYNMFLQNPILGTGFNSYRFALEKYHLSNNEFLTERGSTSNDSSLLFVLATTGVIGFILYITFLIYLLILSFINHQKNIIYGTILFSGLLGLILQSFFINNLFYPWILIWIFLIIPLLNLNYFNIPQKVISFGTKKSSK